MTVENLEINVKTNVSGSSAQTIKSFADALGQLQAKAAALTGLSNLSSLATAMQSISGTSVRASAFSGMAKGIENLAAALKSINNDDVSRLTRITNALRDMNGVNLSGLGNASNIAKAANSLRDTAKGIEEVGKSAKKSQSPLEGFIGSLKRIAFYRLLRTIIKEIAQAFREGLENAYEWSKAVGGDLAPALDRIATASAQMKNQLGAALGELIITLEPIIVELIHFITALAQALTWLFATLNGESEFPLAKEIATGWKEADKAAKEYKKTILGFDVINRLNGPGSGGSTPDYGTKFEYGTAPTMDFKWQNFTPFFKPLDDWTDATLDALAELEALLERIFGKPYELDLNMAWNLDLPLMEKVKQWLDDLVAANPYTAIVTVEVFNPLMEKVKQWLNDLLAPNPYTVQVAVEVFDPQPQMDAVLEKVRGFLDETLNSTVTIMEKLRATVSEKAAQTSAATQTAFDKMREGITTALERARGNATTVYEKLRITLVNKTAQMKQKVSEEYQNIRTSIETSLENARTNVTTFVKSTASALGQWARNSAESARAAFVNIAQNVYLGLTNAGENIATFVNTTASNIWSWASSTASNIVDWATGVANSVGDALSSAWESFKSFMEATGEKVSSWWSKNKTWVVPVAIGAAVTVAAVALAPATGGASLGALAFAENGGMFDSGQLFIAREAGPELVGSIGGRTAVANNDQIVQAVSDGVFNAVTAAMSNENNTDRPISVKVYLDSREIKSGQQRLNRAMGV